MRGYQKQPERTEIAHSQNSALQLSWVSKSSEPRETSRWRGPCPCPRRSLGVQPGMEQTMVQAMVSCSKAWEHVSILAGFPSLPSNLVFTPRLLSLFPVKRKCRTKQKNFFHWDIVILPVTLFKSNLKLNSTNCLHPSLMMKSVHSETTLRQCIPKG